MRHDSKTVQTVKTGFAALVAVALMASTAMAETRKAGFVSFEKAGAFEDVVADLQDEVVNRGLVIDYVGHVNGMLTRTADATGSQSPYANAVYMHFCSAALTHAAVAADPQNIALCPYVVFAYEEASKSGTVTVGYRRPIVEGGDAPSPELKNIEALLEEIVKNSLQ